MVDPAKSDPDPAPADPSAPVDPPQADPPVAVEDPRIAELSNLVVHLKADFDNYRKRTQKEQGAAIRTGELEAVKRFMPALANLERALLAAKDETGGLIDGVRAISHQLEGILGQMGIERIPAAGVPFDPSLPDAVAATPRTDVPPGTVVDEFEPGYRADGKALIPAKVRVSTAE
jgi:molecular chaperone GrpE